MTKFGEIIFTLRKENHLTQEEIANNLNVSRQTISNWETGSAQPTIDKVIELSEIYQVSIDQLVGKNKMTKKKRSVVLNHLLNKKVTLYLNPQSTEFISIQRTSIKDCLVTKIEETSILVIFREKKHTVEKLFFLKDILGFEMEDV
ncbi:MAG TPA: helix-turn-helix domain-containing protein [Candidatus Enterococcus avicola]|uniref:Helix-turn-helix domain-containing protein n=1 Tax=Candidatus Enterococcus avicola TaxID=2838561 RepID=A0A9D2F5I5_9ENTE|nr:helix-turn-helix domain-containing protein [Candidatus Enterococcus avicola]